MTSPLVWLVALGPLAYATAANRNRGATAAAGASVVVAAAAAIAVAFTGRIVTGSIGVAGIGAGIYLDALGSVMFCLVSFVGLIVVTYSRNYLDGDPGQDRFTRLLCITLVAVLCLIISGNLFALAIAWIGTSLALHRLLVFYPQRQAAVLAARKKFIASRIGEACLIAAIVCLYATFGSLDYTTVFAGAQAIRLGASGPPLALHFAALLLVFAALLKSAQFPTHGWATEVMETPTPVSALLHAGIINAGGFLVLRLSGVIALSESSLETLAVVGGFTALFGSVVMLTQTSIKVTLAFSTVAQMGFMMLECGLAAFPSALLHIVAHSLYKAHAFLSSGSVIDIARSSWTRSPGGKPHPARQLIAVVAVLAVAFVVGRYFGFSPTERPGVFALGAVVLLGLIHLVSSSIDERPSIFVVGRTLFAAIVVGASYFGLQLLMERLFGGVFPEIAVLHGPFAVGTVALIVGAFAVVTFLQGLVPGDGGTPRWLGLYALLSNGLYVNTLANRLILRYWPPRTHPISAFDGARQP